MSPRRCEWGWRVGGGLPKGKQEEILVIYFRWTEMMSKLPYAAMKAAASPASSDGTWGKTLAQEAFRSAAYFAISFCSGDEGGPGGGDEPGPAPADDPAEPAEPPTRGSRVLLRWHLPVVGSQSQVWQGAPPASEAAH